MATNIENNIPVSSNFIHKIVEIDIDERVYDGRVHTRFPPEPNGYLHIGSAYAINISYSAAKKYQGKFNLRFDDTNPSKEETKYVDAIIEDMKWLGIDWEERLFYASDYFEQLYDYALELIKKGKAYVCDLSPDEMREYRGTLTEIGKDSPYRNRTVEENLQLFVKMKNGEFKEGTRVLRARIEMTSSNMNMRDPVIYRIQNSKHHRTGDNWFIYPMYDFAHPLSDAMEGITHSLCSAEFINHRPLYDWFLEVLEIKNPPKQREFGRMSLRGVVTSKRYLRKLVEDGYVDGWDDPRMPTIRGLRRRGYTPDAIKNFLGEIGVAKNNSIVDVGMLEHSIREDLKLIAPRVMAVLDPLKVVITNYPEGEVEWLKAENNTENPDMGEREIPFSRVIYIEQEDFMENPPSKYHRLSPGKEVRLKHAYFIKCNEVIKDEQGNVVELHCSYDPETKSGTGFTGRKVKGTIHWVSADQAVKAEVRLYDRLLIDDEPIRDSSDLEDKINPNSLAILDHCYVEASLKNADKENKYQFLRHGYFTVDNKDTNDEKLVFNRTVSLKDSWKKQSGK